MCSVFSVAQVVTAVGHGLKAHPSLKAIFSILSTHCLRFSLLRCTKEGIKQKYLMKFKWNSWKINCFASCHWILIEIWTVYHYLHISHCLCVSSVCSKLLGLSLPLSYTGPPYKTRATKDWLQEQVPYLWQCYW